jgi:hypothetical protein
MFEKWQAASRKIRTQNPPMRFSCLQGSSNERASEALVGFFRGD